MVLRGYGTAYSFPMKISTFVSRVRLSLGATFALSMLSSLPAVANDEKSKEVNDPASLTRRLDLEFNFVDSKALGTISTFAPSLTLPLDRRSKVKFTLPLTGSGLTRNLEVGDIGVSYTLIPVQNASYSLITAARLDLNTGSPSRGTGQGAMTLLPTVGAVFNQLIPGSLVAPLFQWKVSVNAPRDDYDYSIGTFKFIYVKFLPQGQWLRLQPTVNVDFNQNNRTTGLMLVQFGRLLSSNVSANIGYDFNVYGPKSGNGAFQVSVGYLF